MYGFGVRTKIIVKREIDFKNLLSLINKMNGSYLVVR